MIHVHSIFPFSLQLHCKGEMKDEVDQDISSHGYSGIQQKLTTTFIILNYAGILKQ